MLTIRKSLQVFWWSYVLVFIVFSSLQITQIDLWWQIPEGLQILRTGHVPTGPIAAFGFTATPYFDEYAGYEVGLALLYRMGGFIALWAVFSAVYLLIVLLPFARAGKNAERFDFLSTLGLLFGAMLLKGRLEQRPEIVGCLMLVLLFVLLREARLGHLSRRFFIFLGLIFFAWTNIHSNFVIGLVALFIWHGCEKLSAFRQGRIFWRDSLLIPVVAIGATMLNPSGPERLLFPFWQASDPGSIALSMEMSPITTFSDPLGILIIASGAVILLSILWRKVPPWLILFSALSFFLAIEHRRFINLAAISLLFVCAERMIAKAPAARETVFSVALLRLLGLATLCLITLLLAALDLDGIYHEMSHARPFATHVERFAPELVALAEGQPEATLAGLGEGAFLSFNPARPLRPLLDSGLSRFSDDTKRYGFFAMNEPEAFDLALDNLKVNAVVVDRDTLPWIIGLERHADWTLSGCSENGMMWRRKGGAAKLTPADPGQIEKIVAALPGEGNPEAAFFYSTVLGDAEASLRLLAQDNGWDRHDSSFNFVSDWIDRLPLPAIQAFVAAEPAPKPTLLNAMLYARLGAGSFDAFMQKVPPSVVDWRWKLAEVRRRLDERDDASALALFKTISPRPIASAAYYQLWEKLTRRGYSPGDPGAYGRWQTWDAGSRQFVLSMSARLNGQITYFGM
jgi:hypothetical protein